MPRVINPDDFTMSFGDHLEELRTRLIRAMYGIAVTTIVCFLFGRELIAWLCVPLAHAQRAAGLPAQVYNFSPTSGFMIFFKVSLIAGIILAAPWIAYQLWRFVETGLYQSERKVVVLLAPFSTLMMILGVLFMYYIMLPICLLFFITFSTSYPEMPDDQPSLMDWASSWITQSDTGFKDKPDGPPIEPGQTIESTAPDGTPAVKPPSTLSTIDMLAADPAEPVDGQMWIKLPEGDVRLHLKGLTRTFTLAAPSLLSPMINITDYINFVMVLALGIVLAFQLPVVMLIAGWAGIVESAFLAKSRKYCFFICFILGSILTPADIVSMFVLALPLYGLFEFGLILIKLVEKRRHEHDMEENAAKP